MKKSLILIIAAIFPRPIFGIDKLGTIPPQIILNGDDGGLVDGVQWDSATLKDKVHILFYVDPDVSGINSELETALKDQDFGSDEAFRSVAIINMDATWLPNIAIEAKLSSRQKEFPNTIYVKDYRKILVNQWQLPDHSYTVLAFNKEGKVIFQASGALNKEEVAHLITVINTALNRPERGDQVSRPISNN